ncbi:hypothetical protein ACWCQL_11955 [Streptomyces sp. NPDC002073]
MQPTPRTALWVAVTALACGAALCVTGWYGMSGERFAERQIPYLASCTVPGAALLVAGAVLLATLWRPTAGSPAGDGGRPAEPVRAGQPAGAPGDRGEPGAAGPAGEHGAAGGPGDPGAAGEPRAAGRSPGPPLRVPGGTLAHRPDCPLVDGRPDALPAAGGPPLTPCPVCEPPWPA